MRNGMPMTCAVQADKEAADNSLRVKEQELKAALTQLKVSQFG